jgi:hypothetical protein
MENPWEKLLKIKPFVVADDWYCLEKYNQKYDAGVHKLELDVLPEPFIGNIDAPVYLLNLNPGYDESDIYWHAHEKFRASILSNLLHEKLSYPFYFLNPEFNESSGSDWWTKRLRILTSDVGLSTVANKIFCVEFFPYHSIKYKEMPKSITKELLITQEYSIKLVRDAITMGKTIIIMRSKSKWLQYVPELKIHNRVFELKNYQRTYVTPGNLAEYDIIVDLLKND